MESAIAANAAIVALAALAALVLSGCAPASRVVDTPDRSTARVEVAGAQRRCEGLASLAAPGAVVVQLGWVPAGRLRLPQHDSAEPVEVDLPDHCLLRLQADHRRAVDGEPRHIGVEVRLPAHWTRQLMFQGSQGLGGRLPTAIGRNTGARGWLQPGLARGLAVVATDGGHQVPHVRAGLDPQTRTDLAWRGAQRALELAGLVVQRFYGQPPARRYFVGCGEGGRQAMMFTQRMAQAFDGVVAVSPSMRAAEGAAVAAAWSVQQLLRVAPAGDDGRPVLPRALSDAQLARVAAEVLDRCDAADGLVDGLVSDTALCRLDPRRLACPTAGESCLQPAQAQALRELMAGPRSPSGARLYFHWPWDPGLAAPGWRAWMLGSAADADSGARHRLDTGAAIGFLYATPPDPTLDAQGFDFERDPQRLRQAQRESGTAADSRLQGFVDRGGRLLLFHGMADPVNSAFETVDYQERLHASHGAAAASRFSRSFLVPGMNHCAGGPATDDFDGLGAIIDWVESGRAPERIEARGSQALPGLARPLCHYPKVARYIGGESRLSSSFDCR
jgi:hypothetical protein